MYAFNVNTGNKRYFALQQKVLKSFGSLLKCLRSTVKISCSVFLSCSLLTVKAVILVTSCYQDQDPDTGLSLLIALGLLASDLNRFFMK